MQAEIKKILIPPTTTIKDVFEIINKGVLKIALIVNGDQKLLGMVVDGDLRRAIIGNLDLNQEVQYVMNTNPITASLTTAPDKIVEIMKTYSIEQIPILDKQGRPVDVILLSKLIKDDKIIPLCEPVLGEKELVYVMECIQSNWISSAGPFVDKFERSFGDFVRGKYAVATCNGTAAIHIALIVAGVKPGDEVIVPSLTFVGTVNPIIYVGAIPVFVDSEMKTWNIDPSKIEKKLSSKTKAILPVHLYGHPSDMQPIIELARNYNLTVIEDATEALGAKYDGKNVGTIGELGCFSFNGNKLITTGGGGMLVTDNREVAERARFLTTQAKEEGLEYYHSEIGYNYRLTNIQAAIGAAQLEKAEDYISKKRKNAMIYSTLLHDVPGITPCCEQTWAFSSFWMYSILVDDKKFGLPRKELLDKLNGRGIQARPFFKPVHTLPPYQKYDTKDIIIANKIYEQGINLPCSVALEREEIERVVKEILESRSS